MLGLLSQTVLAAFLGVALAVAGVDDKSPGKRFAALYVLAGYFLVFGTLSQFAPVREEKRFDELQLGMDPKLAAHLARAPSRDNLPALEEQPLDRVLLMKGVGDWRPDRLDLIDQPAEQHVGGFAAVAPRPDRVEVPRSRLAHGAGSGGCPVAEGHRDAVSHERVGGIRRRQQNPPLVRGFEILTRFGNHVREGEGPSVWWSSGSMLVVLTYQGHSMTGDLDELLKAYLAKYSSSFQGR